MRCKMQRSRIVVADDDQEIRDTVSIILEGAGYDVTTAKDRNDAMVKIKAEKPNLAILDVMMDSNSDGFEMSRELKKDSELKDIPIILLTGIQKETGIDFESAAGDPAWCPVDAYLNKPFDPELLISKVNELLNDTASE